jgi:hypothetical protein
VLKWLADLDGVDVDALPTKLNQKALRQWKRKNKGHRSFTVVRHPVARAHATFCEMILPVNEGRYAQIRNTLMKVYKVPLPKNGPDASYDVAAHREAFVAYLAFVKANLAGQTGFRIDGHWATQAATLKGFGDLCLPDMIVREDELESLLPLLAMQVGRLDAPEPERAPDDVPFALGEIYDEEIEALVHDIYQRDYLNFGFDSWA